MQINGIFQTKLEKNTQKQAKYNTNPFSKAMENDSVSFTSNKAKRNATRATAFVTAFVAFLNPTAVGNSNQETPIALKANASTFDVDDVQFGIVNTPVASVDKQKEHFDFQMAQTKDRPSLTFDLTDNFKVKTFAPLKTLVYMDSVSSDKNTYTNLNDIITNEYGIKENDIEARVLVAQGILKANPWMAEAISSDEVDYSKGDITNIDPYLMLEADYALNLDDKKALTLPEINVLGEMNNDTDSTVVADVQFVAKNADENGVSYFEVDTSKLGSTDSQIIDNVNAILAKGYGLSTMDSLAGDAVWHGVSLWAQNYDVFKNSSEKDAQQALINYVKNNDVLALELPTIAVTVIDEEGNAKNASGVSVLTQKKDNEITIAYLSPDRAVYDLEETGEKTATLLDLLDTICFMNGTSIKEAYEQYPDKFGALALAAARQEIDNNNALSDYFADKTLTLEDLTKEIDIEAITGDKKINLQPIAIALVEGETSCPPRQNPKPTAPKETEPEVETTEPSEPSRPTCPTRPSCPTDPSTEPTDPSTEPTDPSTEPTCPTMPSVNPGDDEIEETDPTKPSKPTQPTEPSEEPDCPTIETGDPGDVDEPDMEDGGFDIPETTVPTEPKPQPTQPTETEPKETTCPTIETGDPGDVDEPGVGDGGFDIPQVTKPSETKPAETKPAETKPAETKPAETKPAETKPAETKPAETQAKPTSPSSNGNEPGVGDGGFNIPQATQPAEPKPQPTQPAEPKPQPTQPAEPKPQPTQPAEPKPQPTQPAGDCTDVDVNNSSDKYEPGIWDEGFEI